MQDRLHRKQDYLSLALRHNIERSCNRPRGISCLLCVSTKTPTHPFALPTSHRYRNILQSYCSLGRSATSHSSRCLHRGLPKVQTSSEPIAKSQTIEQQLEIGRVTNRALSRLLPVLHYENCRAFISMRE